MLFPKSEPNPRCNPLEICYAENGEKERIIMGKAIRILIAIVVILSLVLISQNQTAWAAKPSSSQNISLSVSVENHKHCDKEKHQKDKCDDDDDDGTVKPPKNKLQVCKNGSYSVGGVATVEIKNLESKKCLNANTRPFDPSVDKLPPNVGRIVSNVVNLELPNKTNKVKVCFAAPPGKQVKIYSNSEGSWKALQTTVNKGITCTEVSSSGTFAVVGK